MSERTIYPDHIITKAVTLARKHGRDIDTPGTGPVVRRAVFDRFTVEFSAVNGSASKANQVEILLDGEKVFSATFESGWEDDPDRKLIHWGPGQGWRTDFMAILD